MGLILNQGTKIPQSTQHSPKQTNNNNKNIRDLCSDLITGSKLRCGPRMGGHCCTSPNYCNLHPLIWSDLREFKRLVHFYIPFIFLSLLVSEENQKVIVPGQGKVQAQKRPEKKLKFTPQANPQHETLIIIMIINSVQALSRVQLFATTWTTAHQASLSITNS